MEREKFEARFSRLYRGDKIDLTFKGDGIDGACILAGGVSQNMVEMQQGDYITLLAVKEAGSFEGGTKKFTIQKAQDAGLQEIAQDFLVQRLAEYLESINLSEKHFLSNTLTSSIPKKRQALAEVEKSLGTLLAQVAEAWDCRYEVSTTGMIEYDSTVDVTFLYGRTQVLDGTFDTFTGRYATRSFGGGEVANLGASGPVWDFKSLATVEEAAARIEGALEASLAIYTQ